MTISLDDERATIRVTSAPTTPRLRLAEDRDAQTVLDGGWWPRTGNPVAELPGLLLALTARYGKIRHLMLNGAAWDKHFRKLAVEDDVVRIGWFNSLDSALAVATNDRGEQIDLVLVPSTASEGLARRAMTVAADPANTRHAAAVLAEAAEAPASEAPASEAPASEAPASEAPASEANAPVRNAAETVAPEANAVPTNAVPPKAGPARTRTAPRPRSTGPAKAAPSKVAPSKVAPSKVAPSKVAPVTVAPVAMPFKAAPVTVAPVAVPAEAAPVQPVPAAPAPARDATPA